MTELEPRRPDYAEHIRAAMLDPDTFLTLFDVTVDGFCKPHAPDGFQTRLAGKVALRDFGGWLNRRVGRPQLASADPIAW